MSDLLEIADPQFQPASGLSLRPDEVQLWRVDLNQVAPAEPRWRQLLSPDEAVRADRFHFERDRRNYTATRALLRMLLGKYVNSAPERVPFVYGERGKPALDSNRSSGSAGSFSFFMCVRYRLALTANRNPLGALRCHSSNVARGGSW